MLSEAVRTLRVVFNVLLEAVQASHRVVNQGIILSLHYNHLKLVSVSSYSEVLSQWPYSEQSPRMLSLRSTSTVESLGKQEAKQLTR